MSWFNDYNRDYDRAAGYDRGRHSRDIGWRSSNYGYDRGWGDSARYGGGYGAGRGRDRGASDLGFYTSRYDDRDYLGRGYGYGYDYQYRRRPEESPTYGRGGDQAVQRWARRYGYDMQYEIEPRGGGGMPQENRGQQGGYGAIQRGYGGWQGGYGTQRGYGRQQGGYGGQQGGYGGMQGGYGRSAGQSGRGYQW